MTADAAMSTGGGKADAAFSPKGIKIDWTRLIALFTGVGLFIVFIIHRHGLTLLIRWANILPCLRKAKGP